MFRRSKQQESNSSHSHSQTVLHTTNLLNDSIISPLEVNPTIANSSRKRYALNNNLSRTSLDLGKFNNSKLSHLYQSHIETPSDGMMINLAYVKNGSLHINDEAIELFQKYQNNPIAFVGNWGRKGSGKSFWYDKILNLSEVQGIHYSKISSTTCQPGLYIWSIPFVKGPLKIFLIDYNSMKTTINSSSLIEIPQPQQPEHLSPEEQKLLDLQMILSEIVVLLPQPHDQKLQVIDQAYTDFHNSQARLLDSGSSKTKKQSPYWPQAIYNLYRSTQPVSTQTDKLSYLFRDYNFAIIHNAMNKQNITTKQNLLQSSMVSSGYRGSTNNTTKYLNEKYIRRTSLVFQNIYSKLHGKKYLNLQYTGTTIPYILNHSVELLNNKNHKYIKMDRMFTNIKKNIYENKFNSGKFIYDVNYDKLQEQPAQPLDSFLNTFQKTNENVLNDYHSKIYDPQLHPTYEEKLLKYGEERQKQLLNHNQGKTSKKLHQQLPYFNKQQKPNPQVLYYLKDLKLNHNQLDHNRCQPVHQRLLDICDCMHKYKYLHVQETQAHYKDRKLELTLNEKKKQLQELKFNRNALVLLNSKKDNTAEQLLDQHNRSVDRIDKTKAELDLSRKKNNHSISDEEYLKQLQAHRHKLQSNIKENDLKISKMNRDLRTDYIESDDPLLSTLRNKLDDRKAMQLQIEAGVYQQSRLNASLLTGRKSQIRKIKQEGIRKSTMNKSMTK